MLVTLQTIKVWRGSGGLFAHRSSWTDSRTLKERCCIKISTAQCVNVVVVMFEMSTPVLKSIAFFSRLSRGYGIQSHRPRKWQWEAVQKGNPWKRHAPLREIGRQKSILGGCCGECPFPSQKSVELISLREHSFSVYPVRSKIQKMSNLILLACFPLAPDKRNNYLRIHLF